MARLCGILTIPCIIKFPPIDSIGKAYQTIRKSILRKGKLDFYYINQSDKMLSV